MLTLVIVAWAALGQVIAASQVAPGILLVPGVFTPGSQPDGNSIVFEAPGGLIVVDTGRHARHVAAIEEVAGRAARPIVAIINTHWHLDHLGGNSRLRRDYPGLRVYASSAIREARTGFLATYRHELEGLLRTTADPGKRAAFEAEMGLIDQGVGLEPDETIEATETRTIAGLRLEVGLERHAVTAGDVWIFEPRTKVLVAGDLVTIPAPLLDTACPAGWEEALARLARVDFTTLVPGHGPPMTRVQFERYRSAFTGLLACGRSDRSKESCISGWLSDAGPLVPEEERAFTRSLMEYYVGVLRSDPAAIAKRCGG